MFKTFGCACYPFIESRIPNKLSPTLTMCVFIGYASNRKGWHCLNRAEDRVIVSRHVMFDETKFVFSEKESLQSSDNSLNQASILIGSCIPTNVTSNNVTPHSISTRPELSIPTEHNQASHPSLSPNQTSPHQEPNSSP